jgi:hypothetical protein
MTSLVFGITFFVIFESLVVYALFFSSAINWSSNVNFISIFKNEIRENGRFLPMILGIVAVHIMALIALIKSLKKPRKIHFSKSSIQSDKNFNDLNEINLEEINQIEKSFYPLLLTGYTKEGVWSIIGLFVAFPFFVIATIVLWMIKFVINLFSKDDLPLILFPYIVFFSNTTNRVINVHLMTKNEFDNLNSYLIENFNTRYETLKVNSKIRNISS